MAKQLVWLVMTHILGITECMFFHEPSAFVITAAAADNNTYLGYSLSYQKGLNNLVFGAPNDRTGNVFTCSLDLDSTKDVFLKNCTRYDDIQPYVEGLKGQKRSDDNHKFMLGASVAALPNSFMTCAPMWTGQFDVTSVRDTYRIFFVWGNCFEVRNSSEISVLSGLYGIPRKKDVIKGNFGLRMLVDDVNQLVLITEPASPPCTGDVIYIKQGSPLTSTKSLAFNERGPAKNAFYILRSNGYRNLGTGLAFGSFFDVKRTFAKTIYAIGLTDRFADGQVIFVFRHENGALLLNMKTGSDTYRLDKWHDERNSLFGFSLSGAQLNGDNYTDLIVGAPAQANYDKTEFGAIHIYTGAKSIEDFIQRKLTIMGKTQGSRFGTTISTHDLDRDGLHEIFVSAPYENDNKGVVYILSGYEMKYKLSVIGARSSIGVLDFESKQIVEKEGFQLLGFSMTPVGDMDENGCDEFAVGAPLSDKIVILRCIPTVNITVTAELLGPQILPDTINDFQINLCANIVYGSKMNNITADVQMEIDIKGTGEVTIKTDRIFRHDLRSKLQNYCSIVNVTIADNRQGHYTFDSRAELLTNISSHSKFYRSWVRISPYSKLSETLEIERACSGKECFYNFTMNFKWTGGEIKGDGTSYAVGSKDEALTLQISNYGRIAYSACVVITVDHAPVSQLDCSLSSQGYLCSFPAGFMKNETKDIQIQLMTSKMTDEFKISNISAILYEDCVVKKLHRVKNFVIDFEFNADVSIEGSSITSRITEKSMKTDSETIDVLHEYTIENKGRFWRKNVIVVISHEGNSFVRELKVLSYKCEGSTHEPDCTLDLAPTSKIKLIVVAVLWKREIENQLENQKLKIVTSLKLHLLHTSTSKNASVVTIPIYEKDSSIGQNIILIICLAILLALIMIAVVTFILYKLGFFKRKQKDALEKRRRRSRQSSRSSAGTSQQDCFEEVTEEDVDVPLNFDDAAENSNLDSVNRCSKQLSNKEINDSPSETAVDNYEQSKL